MPVFNPSSLLLSFGQLPSDRQHRARAASLARLVVLAWVLLLCSSAVAEQSVVAEQGVGELSQLAVGISMTGTLASQAKVQCANERQNAELGGPEANDAELLDDRGAPMCDPSAASVVALPFIPDSQGGRLDELPCDERAAFQSLFERPFPGVCLDNEQSPTRNSQGSETVGAPAEGGSWLTLRPRAHEPASAKARQLEAEHEHRLGVYRPPLIS